MRTSMFMELADEDAPLLTDPAERFRVDFFRGSVVRDEATLRDLAQQQLDVLMAWHAEPLTDSPFVSGVVPGSETSSSSSRRSTSTEDGLSPGHHKRAAEHYKRKLKWVLGRSPSPPPKRSSTVCV